MLLPVPVFNFALLALRPEGSTRKAVERILPLNHRVNSILNKTDEQHGNPSRAFFSSPLHSLSVRRKLIEIKFDEKNFLRKLNSIENEQNRCTMSALRGGIPSGKFIFKFHLKLFYRQWGDWIMNRLKVALYDFDFSCLLFVVEQALIDEWCLVFSFHCCPPNENFHHSRVKLLLSALECFNK